MVGSDRGVQPAVVEPADVAHARELELRVGAPHAVADELGFVAIDERLGEGVVVRISDAADRRQHAMIVEQLGVVPGRILRALVGVLTSCDIGARLRVPTPS